MTAVHVPGALLEVDEACLAAATRLLDTLGEWPSPVGHRRFREALAAARRAAGEEEARGAAAPLVLRHLRAGWDALEAVVRYRWEWPRVDERELLAPVAGDGIVGYATTVLRDAGEEELWAYLEARQGQSEGRLPPGSPAARRAVQEAADRLVGAFRAWLRERGWDLPGLDVEVTLDPSGRATSSYRPARRVVVLGGAEFLVFGEEACPRVNPAIALHSLAHELAGHAVHAALSRDLPAPLRPDDRARLRFASLPVSEGFAGYAGRLALSFAREAGDAVGLAPGAVGFVEQVVRLTPVHHATAVLLDVAALRARREPRFDPVSWLESTCGHGGFGEVVAGMERVPVYKLLYDAASLAGLREVEETASRLERRGVEGPAAWRRLGRGAWALACYREAVLGEGVGGS